MSLDLFLSVLAFICFVLAGLGVSRARWEWFGVACLVLAQII